MADSSRFRLRLKLPSGAELEAEGSPEFVQAERQAFLDEARPRTKKGGETEPGPGYEPPAWGEILESRAGNLQLRAKPPGRAEKEACLILLAGAAQLMNLSKPTAAQLARWLRASGYPIGRVDRALADAIQRGEILASGSRRARRYELTGPGRAKAFLLAEELARAIAGPKKAG